MGIDINGDGRSDLLLLRYERHSYLTALATTDGAFPAATPGSEVQLPFQWWVTGIGDFNGDGRGDVLWRYTDGQVSDWLGQSDGTFFNNGATMMSLVPREWRVIGTGDFNGDGRDDILWTNGGVVTNWLGLADGSFANNHAASVRALPGDGEEWTMVAAGDFNGDGFGDVVWRRYTGELAGWLGTESGAMVDNPAIDGVIIPTSWLVIGADDFNGDGRDDLLWQYLAPSGLVTNWLGQSDGSFVNNHAASATAVGEAFVANIGDYNGDGHADFFTAHDSAITQWMGTQDGGFVANPDGTLASAWLGSFGLPPYTWGYPWWEWG